MKTVVLEDFQSVSFCACSNLKLLFYSCENLFQIVETFLFIKTTV
jgi:hypothetical protein